jgi:tRNA A-37 threonylcarbamoyl transferase component Bud32
MTAVQTAPGLAADLHRQGLRTFRDYFDRAGGRVVGGHPARNVAYVELGRLAGFLKREFRTPWKDYLASWWAGFGFVSKSRREWRILRALQRCGIGCPQPVAVGEEGGRAFLLVRVLPDAVDLPTYLAQEVGPAERSTLARRLGAALARLHAAGFTHPDLYAKHVFVNLHDRSIAFIDFQRTRYRPRVSWRCRWRDLAALDASLSEELVPARERFACLAAYLRAAGALRRRRRFRQALRAIIRRTRHLLGRRKVRAMRKACVLPADSTRVEFFRVVVADHDPLPPHDPAAGPSALSRRPGA